MSADSKHGSGSGSSGLVNTAILQSSLMLGNILLNLAADRETEIGEVASSLTEEVLTSQMATIVSDITAHTTTDEVLTNEGQTSKAPTAHTMEQREDQTSEICHNSQVGQENHAASAESDEQTAGKEEDSIMVNAQGMKCDEKDKGQASDASKKENDSAIGSIVRENDHNAQDDCKSVTGNAIAESKENKNELSSVTSSLPHAIISHLPEVPDQPIIYDEEVQKQIEEIVKGLRASEAGIQPKMAENDDKIGSNREFDLEVKVEMRLGGDVKGKETFIVQTGDLESGVKLVNEKVTEPDSSSGNSSETDMNGDKQPDIKEQESAVVNNTDDVTSKDEENKTADFEGDSIELIVKDVVDTAESFKEMRRKSSSVNGAESTERINEKSTKTEETEATNVDGETVQESQANSTGNSDLWNLAVNGDDDTVGGGGSVADSTMSDMYNSVAGEAQDRPGSKTSTSKASQGMMEVLLAMAAKRLEGEGPVDGGGEAMCSVGALEEDKDGKEVTKEKEEEESRVEEEDEVFA